MSVKPKNMNSQRMPKMSLVAQFDDLCRYTKVLTAGCEEEFKTFVENQRLYLKKWKESEHELKKLKKTISNLESEKELLNTKVKHLRNLFEMEARKRMRIEEEKNSMERQIALVKEVLLADRNAMDDQTKEKLAFLNSASYKHNMGSPTRLETIEESMGSLLSLSEIDKTDEDIMDDVLHRSKAKRSIPQNGVAPKRKKSEEKNADDDKRHQATELNGLRTVTNPGRSNSEPATISPELPPPPRFFHRSDSEQLGTFQNDYNKGHLGTISGGTPLRQRLSLGGKLGRSHSFSAKTVIRPENCFPCGVRINFCKQALKCQDCRVTCHIECKDLCPLPCIPAKHTPTQKGIAGTIADYTSNSSPMIPSLIVHCVHEIESRGLKEVGLYRISGSEREVKELKEKLVRGRTVPSLSHVDIHAVCGAVKEFLRSLKEPLIPRASWKIFVKASEMSDVGECLNTLYNIVGELPQSNKDTLAFLIMHLHRIAEAPECKMPIENLAKVFGPTVVGYSVSEPIDANLLSETKHQFKVMHRLLSIPTDLWQNLMDAEPEVFIPGPKTPESRPAPEGHLLGPISSGQKSKGTRVGKTALTPRTTRSISYKTGRKPIFSSPRVK